VDLLDEGAGPGEGCSAGNAGTLGISAPNRRLTTPPFLYTAPQWLLRAPSAEGPAEQNRFCNRQTFLDACFWLWGISYLRLLLTHKCDGIPFMKEWQRRTAEEREAIAIASKQEGVDAFVIAGRLVPVFGKPVAGSYTSKAVGGVRLSPEECLEHEPCLQGAMDAGLISEGYWYATDGHGDCRSYVRKLVDCSVRKYGMNTRFNACCDRIVVSNGRCVGVQLKAGEIISADAVVLANGSGAAPLASSAAVYIPVQALRGYSLTVPVRADATAPVPRGSMVTQPHEMYISRVNDADLGDCIRFAAYGELSPNWLKEPTPALIERLEKLVRLCVPNVEEMVDWSKRREWVGARPLSPDSNPIVGPTRVPGLFLNVGLSFNGWRQGTMMGVICAHGMAKGWDSTGIYKLIYSPQRWQPWRPSHLQQEEVPCLEELLLPFSNKNN